jgi:uncharacterized protein YdeI (YjbR/CyaY-like superfamily)
MATKDPRIDAYIADAAPFAQPILKHLRKIVHTGCPKAQETLKWSMPHFDYKGVMCGMAAFKAHCTFGFWKASLFLADDSLAEREAMGQFGRITKLADLPPDKVLLGYVRKAAALNEAGIKSPPLTKPRKQPGPLEVPSYFTAALCRNKKAAETFAALSYSCRKEYIAWLTEAKRDATRAQRLATALEWLSEGKTRNWKYQRC